MAQQLQDKLVKGPFLHQYIGTVAIYLFTYCTSPMDPGEVSVLAQLLQHLAQHLSPDDATEALRKVQQAAPHSQMRLEQCFFWIEKWDPIQWIQQVEDFLIPALLVLFHVFFFKCFFLFFSFLGVQKIRSVRCCKVPGKNVTRK